MCTDCTSVLNCPLCGMQHARPKGRGNCKDGEAVASPGFAGARWAELGARPEPVRFHAAARDFECGLRPKLRPKPRRPYLRRAAAVGLFQMRVSLRGLPSRSTAESGLTPRICILCGSGGRKAEVTLSAVYSWGPSSRLGDGCPLPPGSPRGLPSTCVFVPISSCHKSSSHVGLGPTLRTPFLHNYPL